MNIKKRRVQAIAGGNIVEKGMEGKREGEGQGEEEEDNERRGRQEEKSLCVIATPLPQLFTTTVINYNSTSATAVTAN